MFFSDLHLTFPMTSLTTGSANPWKPQPSFGEPTATINVLFVPLAKSTTFLRVSAPTDLAWEVPYFSQLPRWTFWALRILASQFLGKCLNSLQWKHRVFSYLRSLATRLVLLYWHDAPEIRYPSCLLATHPLALLVALRIESLFYIQCPYSQTTGSLSIPVWSQGLLWICFPAGTSLQEICEGFLRVL